MLEKVQGEPEQVCSGMHMQGRRGSVEHDALSVFVGQGEVWLCVGVSVDWDSFGGELGV